MVNTMQALLKILILLALVMVISGCVAQPPGIPQRKPQTHAILDITLYAGDTATLNTSAYNETYWVNIT
jgi:starvation-inducible outer membrane lipoprotein